MADKIFADGFVFDRRDNAPDFVIGRVSVKVEEAIKFLQTHKNERGWVNIQVKKSDKGFYTELDTWKPTLQADGKTWTPKVEPVQVAGDERLEDSIPF